MEPPIGIEGKLTARHAPPSLDVGPSMEPPIGIEGKPLGAVLFVARIAPSMEPPIGIEGSRARARSRAESATFNGALDRDRGKPAARESPQMAPQ